MVAANTQNCRKPRTIERRRYNFERVDNFIYLGSLMTGDNNVPEEITNRLIAANRSYFGLKSNFKSQLLSRNPKNSHTLNTSQANTYTRCRIIDCDKNDRKPSIFESKVLHRIYGPICEKGQWQKKYNTELQDLYNRPNIVNVIKSSTLRWADQVTQMDENKSPQQISCTNTGGQ
jgi:hypothetical protein